MAIAIVEMHSFEYELEEPQPIVFRGQAYASQSFQCPKRFDFMGRVRIDSKNEGSVQYVYDGRSLPCVRLLPNPNPISTRRMNDHALSITQQVKAFIEMTDWIDDVYRAYYLDFLK